MRWQAVSFTLVALAGATAAWAQQPAPPRMLVPPDIRPGEVAPDPRITVPERIVPAPPGSGAEVPLPPSSSEAVVPPGGGDPGILAPTPDPPKPPPGTPENQAPRRRDRGAD